MRILAHIGAAYLTFLLLGALLRILPLGVMAPQAHVVFAAYLGITARGRLPSSTLGALIIGYLADLLSGSPRGLLAFSCGLLCILAHVASSRLLVRGRVFVGVFAIVAGLFSFVILALLRAFHGAPLLPWPMELTCALGAGLVTGLLAPLLFRMSRLIDAAFARTEREREAVREGYLS
ncbi:MAG: hypothetical protein HY698_13210 [Deltaproteobacteria bacterium]|nr:hypothetical protein [Deltaproteobacteria bacterium]